MPEIFRRLSACAVALLLAAWPATLTEPLDVGSFTAELDRVAAAVAAADPSRLAELRTQVPARWVVRAGAAQFDVSTAWIVQPIDVAADDPSTWPVVRGALLAKLAAVRAEAQRLGTSPIATNSDSARAVLQDVLSRREFEATRNSSWTKQLREQISRWLLGLWKQVGGERLGRRSTAIALAWIAVLAALGVLASWLVRGLVHSQSSTRLHLIPAASRRLSARAWALRAVSAADPREAARCAYHAAVRRLEEEGAWREDEARTPREYLRLLPSSHGRRAIVADVTNRFEQIWYGGRAATADDVRSVVAGLKDLGCLPAD